MGTTRDTSSSAVITYRKKAGLKEKEREKERECVCVRKRECVRKVVCLRGAAIMGTTRDASFSAAIT